MKRLAITGPVLITALVLGGLAGCSGTQTSAPPLAETSAPASPTPASAASPTPPSEPAQTPAAACDPLPEGQADEPCYDTGPAQEKIPYDASNAPRSFIERVNVPSCGTYDLGPRLTPSVASDCLAAAIGSENGAEYAVNQPSTEGEPIVIYYRALPGQSTVTVFTDSTRAKFGNAVWTQVTCDGYNPATADVVGCDTGNVLTTQD